MFVQQNSKEVRSEKLNHSQRATALSPLNRHSTAGQGETPRESRTHTPGTSGLSYAGHTFYEILKARQLPCPTLTSCRLTCVGSSHSVTPDAPRGKVTLCQPRLLRTGTEHLTGMSPGTSCKQTQTKPGLHIPRSRLDTGTTVTCRNTKNVHLNVL